MTVSMSLLSAATPTQSTRYELLYTDSADEHSSRHRRLQRPSIPFWLASATFDEHGTPLGRRNITKPQDGMGYLSLSPDGQHALFATERPQPQGWSNVDTFIVPLNGSTSPLPLFNSMDALLQPCVHSTPPCTQVSTFHATFSPDGEHVVFAYRAWSSLGVATGSQALAIADVDGGNVRPLTYDVEHVSTQDMCPTLLPATGGMVAFMRSTEQGFHKYIAILNISSGEVSEQRGWPEVGDGAGCPAPLGESSFMYLGCDKPPCDVASGAHTGAYLDDGAAQSWGLPMRTPTTGWPRQQSPVRASSRSGWAQLKVDLLHGKATSPTLMFPIGLTTAPGYVGVFRSSQCDQIWGNAKPANDSIVCEGADPKHLFFMKDFVNPASGEAARNDTGTLRSVMTPRPYVLRHVRYDERASSGK